MIQQFGQGLVKSICFWSLWHQLGSEAGESTSKMTHSHSWQVEIGSKLGAQLGLPGRDLIFCPHSCLGFLTAWAPRRKWKLSVLLKVRPQTGKASLLLYSVCQSDHKTRPNSKRQSNRLHLLVRIVTNNLGHLYSTTLQIDFGGSRMSYKQNHIVYIIVCLVSFAQHVF